MLKSHALNSHCRRRLMRVTSIKCHLQLKCSRSEKQTDQCSQPARAKLNDCASITREDRSHLRASRHGHATVRKKRKDRSRRPFKPTARRKRRLRSATRRAISLRVRSGAPRKIPVAGLHLLPRGSRLDEKKVEGYNARADRLCVRAREVRLE